MCPFCRWVPFWASQNAVCNQSLVGNRLCVIFSIFISSVFFFFLDSFERHGIMWNFLTHGTSLWMSQQIYDWMKWTMFFWNSSYLFIFVYSVHKDQKSERMLESEILMSKFIVVDFMIWHLCIGNRMSLRDTVRS